MIIDDLMKDKITLHGLGFIQVQLEGNQRLHVWHPDLPKRSCFEHSAIHDHRFSFISSVLVGTQINHAYKCIKDVDGEYDLYLHEGKRMAGGGRPWDLDGRANLILSRTTHIHAGSAYDTDAYEYHRTEAGGDGKVATIMIKTWEGKDGAHSTCLHGVSPDTDFDRYQWTPSKLWEIVSDVLLSGSK
jgi:hypothetical protein